MVQVSPIPAEHLPDAVARLLEQFVALEGRLWAAEQLALAAATMIVEASQDPLAASEELRRRALDPLPEGAPGYGIEGAKQQLERMLAQIEEFATRRPEAGRAP